MTWNSTACGSFRYLYLSVPGSQSVQMSKKTGRRSKKITDEQGKNGEKREWKSYNVVCSTSILLVIVWRHKERLCSRPGKSLQASIWTPHSTYYPAHFLKTISHIKMLSAQMCRAGKVSHIFHISLTLHARSQVSDESFDVNCKNWLGQPQSVPGAGILKWGIENNAYHLHFSISLQPMWFSRTLSTSPKILEPETGCRNDIPCGPSYVYQPSWSIGFCLRSSN